MRRDLPRRPTGDHMNHVAGDNDDSGDADSNGVKRATHPPFQHCVKKGAFGTCAQSLPGRQSPSFL